MLKKLKKQLNGEEWSWNNLNTICWAIGSISGSTVKEQVCMVLLYSFEMACGNCFIWNQYYMNVSIVL
jgi:exportin-1